MGWSALLLKKASSMALERTLSIIKPDATKRNLTGKINAKFEDAGPVSYTHLTLPTKA